MRDENNENRQEKDEQNQDRQNKNQEAQKEKPIDEMVKQNNQKKENQQKQQNEKNFKKQTKQLLDNDSAIENIFAGKDKQWEEVEQVEAPPTVEEVIRQQLDEANDKLLRTKAEMENLHRRTDKEKRDITNYATADFARSMLSVSDNIDRALASLAKGEKDKAEPSIKNLIIGIEMTQKELNKVFESHGIKKISPLGEKFDPNFHQAIFSVKTDQYPQGYVAQIIADGFLIKDRVLRPAMVGVAEIEQQKKEQQEQDDKEQVYNDLEEKDIKNGSRINKKA